MANPRSTRFAPLASATPEGAASETRPVGGDELRDAALDWLDAALADDIEIDEATVDLLALADEEAARPIPEDEITPSRPVRSAPPSAPGSPRTASSGRMPVAPRAPQGHPEPRAPSRPDDD